MNITKIEETVRALFNGTVNVIHIEERNTDRGKILDVDVEHMEHPDFLWCTISFAAEPYMN